jgi:hypothetical protein
MTFECNTLDNNTDDLDDTDEDHLRDLSWVTQFELTDQDYKDFYAEDITFVKFTAIYVDNSSNITRLAQDTIFLSAPNVLGRDELMHIIKSYSILNHTKYSILGILKYNINISPHNLKSFLHHKTNALKLGEEYLTLVHNIDTITFDKTINIFQDINELILIFYNPSIGKHYSHSVTKRIRLSKLNKTTRKNMHMHIPMPIPMPISVHKH